MANPIELSLACLAMLILLVASALISGSEVAYFSINPAEKDELQGNKIKSASVILELLERPKKLLATILIANNFVNVAIVILSTYIADGLIPETLSQNTKLFIQIVLVTFLLLLLGEVIPKVYANAKPLKLASFMALPTLYLRSLLSPLSSLLVSSTNFIDKRIKKKGHNISVDELSHALELTSDDTKTEEDHKILEGIVKFGNTDVKQVMTSRVDTVSIDINKTYQEVIDTILDSGYSRIPVYEDSFDNIKGILYIKDLLPHLNKETFKWTTIIRKPFFVPENKKIDDLLKEFQFKKIHLAVVVDEYGGSSGIISLEDILEEIVGEISDEFDDEDLEYSKLDDFNYVFEGKIGLNDMYRILGIDGDEFEEVKGESESLAGLVIELFGKIPKKGEKIRLKDYLISIEAADKRRIKRIKLSLQEKQNFKS
ncbi:MAG: gliding motility-associated protein GldE [Bacteroidetes bacterium]|nr:MAG: gliding motility-associated protein GldE [Bacteroidota bacterium]MBL1143936.1 gliding motility-associated protein GldE [Bacteroidota bacterium]MCB0802375.1 gliding motility-associated protein GldE [Flavobacteriales bacterium]NOG56737.1 gliding motility-associated protein GldE [Bacteroidota bacterium]